MSETAKRRSATGQHTQAIGLVRAKPRAGRPPRGKTLLSEERMLKVAIAIVDDTGMDSLSMRHLAERLGVTAMSLYRYVDSHEALLDAIHRQIISEQEPHPITREQSYREVLTDMAKALRRAFKTHPKAAALFATRPNQGQRGLTHLDATIGHLVSAGFDFAMAVYLIDAVAAFTVGLCLAEAAKLNRSSSGTGSLEGVSAPPAQAQTATYLERWEQFEHRHDYDSEFIIGILALIDGFGSRFAKRAK